MSLQFIDVLSFTCTFFCTVFFAYVKETIYVVSNYWLLLMSQADPNADVRGRMINAGIVIIDKHGRDNVSLLFPIFENYLNKKVRVLLLQQFNFQEND